MANNNLPSLTNKFHFSVQELFYLTEIGGSDQVPNGDPNTIYFHAPNDPPGKWRPLHDIAAKVHEHSIN